MHFSPHSTILLWFFKVSILYSQFSINAVADGLLLCSINAKGFRIVSADEVCVSVCLWASVHVITVQDWQYSSEAAPAVAACSSIRPHFSNCHNSFHRLKMWTEVHHRCKVYRSSLKRKWHLIKHNEIVAKIVCRYIVISQLSSIATTCSTDS